MCSPSAKVGFAHCVVAARRALPAVTPRRWAARLAAISLLLTLAPGLARAAEHRAISDFAFGLAAVGTNFVYGPAKLLYALGGSVVAPLAYLSAGQDRSVFRKVIQPAVRGDYALSADQLRGERPWHFFGRDPERGPYPY